MKREHNESRRQFIQKSAVFGTGIILAGPVSQRLFAQGNQLADPAKRVPSKGYAALDRSGKLSPWTFERRPVGDDDILVDIKFSGICHSDIHQLRGEWGPQKYPQVPGHEIAGVVAGVGKKVNKFKVGDHAGVGCMVDEERCARIRRQRYSDQRGLSGDDQHADGGGNVGKGAGSDERDSARPADRATWRVRGNRRRSPLALQPWRNLRDRPRTRCRWWVHRALRAPATSTSIEM
jgi:Alcohol dehydrogenase GroES-like domain